jgi:hypothetical protein
MIHDPDLVKDQYRKHGNQEYKKFNSHKRRFGFDKRIMWRSTIRMLKPSVASRVQEYYNCRGGMAVI